MKFQKPFRVGDVARKIGDTKETIISEVVITAWETIEYATSEEAWITHENLELVRKCNKASMRYLFDRAKGEEVEWL